MNRIVLVAPLVVATAVLAFLGKQSVQRSVTAASPPAAPQKAYVILFSYSGEEYKPKFSHTFAAFVRTTGEPGRLNVVEHCTISWLPRSGIISLARPAEPGVNLSLQDTLDLAERQGSAISYLGPFEIREELYRKAVAQAERLERGELRYKAFDHYTRSTAKNCIHAVSDICEEHGRLGTGTTHGLPATRLVARSFEPYYLGAEASEDVAYEIFKSLNLRQISALRHEMLFGEGEAVGAQASE